MKTRIRISEVFDILLNLGFVILKVYFYLFSFEKEILRNFKSIYHFIMHLLRFLLFFLIVNFNFKPNFLDF